MQLFNFLKAERMKHVVDLRHRKIHKTKTDCVVIPVGADGSLSGSGAGLDSHFDGLLSRVVESGDLSDKSGSVFMVTLPSGDAARCALVRLPENVEPRGVAEAYAKACSVVRDSSCSENCIIVLESVSSVEDSVSGESSRTVARLCAASLYDFNAFRQTSAKKPRLSSARLKFAIGSSVSDDFSFKKFEKCVSEGLVAAKAEAFAKDLANTPPNVCTPRWFAERSVEGAAELGLKAKIFKGKEIRELGMTSFLSVAGGATNGPRLVELHWRGGAKSRRPVVLVGKGITFDSGGISLKPGEAMDEMKFDMCGAASAVAAVRAAAELRLPINVSAVVPLCENMPGPDASRPGDVVVSKAGISIEILNTDAEGRLILCDAIEHARSLDPLVVVDIATLTGACVVALGAHASGLFSSDDELASMLLASGERVGDRAWRMPIWEEYAEQLKSTVADVGNIGGRGAGAITAACFLAKFAKGMRWAHIDIAGSAWKDKKATGRPVPLLIDFLTNSPRLKDQGYDE